MAASLLSLLSPKDRSGERSESILRLGRRQLESLRVEGHPYGESRVRALRRLLADGGGLPLLFPDHDVGFRYSGKGAAVFAGTRTATRPRPVGAAGGSPVSSNRQLLGGDHERGDHCRSTVSSRAPSPPPFGTLCLGGRMPHFILRPLRDEGIDSSACKDAIPSLSTVDLPDQIRGLLLSCADSKVPATAHLAVFGSRDATRACQARASLASVLVVSLPSVPVHLGDGDRPDDGNVVAAAKAVSTRWLSAVVGAQRPEVGGDSKGTTIAGTGAPETDRRTPFRPVIVLMVSPPRCASISTTPSASITGTTTKRAPSINHLEAYWDPRISNRTSPVTSSEHMDAEARAAVAAEGPQHSADEMMDLVATTLASRSRDEANAADDDDGRDGGDSDGERFDARAAVLGGQVLSMYAIDDGAGSLGKAFGAAGVEAVLLRPDGHIAWLGLGLDVGSKHGARGEVVQCREPTLVRELRSALDTVYHGED